MLEQILEIFDSPSNTQSDLKTEIETLRRKFNSFDFALRSKSTHYLKKKKKGKRAKQEEESQGFFGGFFRSSAKEEVAESVIMIEKSELIKIHSKLIQAQMRASSAERRWRSLLLNIRGEESLLDGTMRAQECCWVGVKEYGNTPESVSHIEDEFDDRDLGVCRLGFLVLPIPRNVARRFYRMMDTIRLFWRRHLYRYACRLLALLCACASGLILYSELAMSTDLRSPIGFLLVNMSDKGAGLFMVQTVSFLYLFYMSFCTFFSFFRMNFGWSFTLQVQAY